MDKIPRLLSIKPNIFAYGIIRLGCTYRFSFSIQNIGYSISRYRINPPKNPCFWCISNDNKVSPGMSNIIDLELLAVEEGEINENLEIVTECEVYNIPITGLVLNANEYDKYLNQRRRHNRPLYSDNVRLYSAIPTSSRPDISVSEIKEIQECVDEVLLINLFSFIYQWMILIIQILILKKEKIYYMFHHFPICIGIEIYKN